MQREHYTKRAWRRAGGLCLIALLISLVGGYAAPAPAPLAAQGAGEVPDAGGAFAPFLNIVPDVNGVDVLISAGGLGQIDGQLFAGVGIGPGGRRRSYTMTYSDTITAYTATATGFTPQVGSSGTLELTATVGIAAEVISFQRAFVPYDPGAPLTEVIAEDGNLSLAWADPATIPFDTYLVIAPSPAPPGPPPEGHRLIGSSYSVRAAGALAESAKPMLLSMGYSELLLDGTPPQHLAIFAWDAALRSWLNLGGELFDTTLTTTTARFTTYALMAAPAWRDGFNDSRGLSPSSTVRINALAGTAVLTSTQRSGIAISLPISPTVAIERWGTLTYRGAAAPPTTTLRIDVLSANGSLIIDDLGSGASLAAIDPRRDPVIRLRARLASQQDGATPSLDSWEVTWQVRARELRYLPLIRR